MAFVLKKANKKRRGMTLTELAIVLCAAGLVMAAIWAIVSVVWDNYRYYKTKEQLMTVVNNIRDYYGPMGGLYSNAVTKTAEANDTDITDTLNSENLHLIPIEMRLDPMDDAAPVNHALGMDAAGSFRVLSENNGRTMRVQLSRVNKSSCIRFMMDFPYLTPEIGVTRVAANGNEVDIDLTDVAHPGGAVDLPLKVTTAEDWCDIITSAGNEVEFDFKVKN